MTNTPVAAEAPPAISPAAPAAADTTPAAAPITEAAPVAAAPDAPSAAPAPAEAAKTESSSSLLSSADGKTSETKDAPKEQPAPAADPAKVEAKDAPKEPEAKPAEATDPAKTADAAPQPPALVKYEELKVPEGLDEGRVKSWLDIVNDPKLSASERASKELEVYKEAVKEIGEQAAAHQRKVWTDMNEAWKDQVRKDPEIGGQNMDKSLSAAKALAEEFMQTPEEKAEFFRVVEYTGMGNNPIVLKFMSRVAKQLNVFETGITPANAKPPNPPKGPGNRGWYPTMGGTAA